MTQNARFGLALRVLTFLAAEPDTMHTSMKIAESLDESAVMVRRTFLRLHEAGFITQRKGPSGGARLKMSAREIGLGDLYAATTEDWLAIKHKTVGPILKRVQSDALKAMNETTLAQVVKRIKKT